MAIQLSVAVRNAKLNAIETTIGTDPVMEIRTGSAPASCATARSGTVLATLTLPTDWLGNAASGSKAKSGTWADASADADGDAGYFTIYASDGTTVHMQGTCGVGSGDLQLNTITLVSAQAFTVTSFSLTEANA